MANKVKDQVFDFGGLLEDDNKEEAVTQEVMEDKEIKTETKESVKIPNTPNEKPTSWSGTQGIKGAKLPRMNLAFHPDTYNKIKECARAKRMTYSEFLTYLVQNYDGE